ncbi:MAG TPA: NAD-dependent epimerase/dehydratase family protein [Candidatus Absconditabacterales bacterium]|nr:NAD-dependent epimerase/dehydratase family protein [Candidatus Absconditabacterales bacterium]
MSETILITGTSGFIGFHLAKRLLEEGRNIIGFDNENDYYDVNLKVARRNILEKYNNFKFYKGSLENLEDLKKVFEENKIDKVCNLAAQAGVTYSYKNPYTYIQSNIVGFHNLIDIAKNNSVKNFVYASTGSVYGNNKKDPAEVEDKCESPLSIYGASKKTNELIAHSYSSMYGIQTIGLRFFNVVGSRGRPDSALFIFTKNILEGKTIEIRNHGKMRRNNTYVGDIVDGIIKSLDFVSNEKYNIFNLGNENKVELMYFVEQIEKSLGIESKKEFVDMLPGEPAVTSVDSSETRKILGWRTTKEIEDVIEEFVDWYKEYKG